MTNTHFAKGQVLFREGEPADSVFRLLRGAVDIRRTYDSNIAITVDSEHGAKTQVRMRLSAGGRWIRTLGSHET